VIERAIKRYGLRIRIGEDVSVVNPEQDERFREYWQSYHKLTERGGVTAQYAKLEMRRRTTLIAAMLLKKGEADGLICGTISTTARHLHYIDQVIGRRAGVNVYGAMSGLILPGRQVFIVDTHVNLDPARSNSRKSPASLRSSCAILAWCPRRHCCRIRILEPATLLRP